jgi:glycosyltransferase involved in cell wall biosynthesis
VEKEKEEQKDEMLNNDKPKNESSNNDQPAPVISGEKHIIEQKSEGGNINSEISESPTKVTKENMGDLKSSYEDFPFQADLDEVEKKINPEEDKVENPKGNLVRRPEKRVERSRSTNQSRENLRNTGTRQPHRPTQVKKEAPDPTIVNLRVDKGLVKTPVEIESTSKLPPTSRDEKKEPREHHRTTSPPRQYSRTREPVVKTETRDKEPVIKTETRDREPVVKTESRDREPVVKTEPRDREPVVKTEPRDREPVVKTEPRDREPVVKTEPRDREPATRPENRDRDRNVRRNPREPYKSTPTPTQTQTQSQTQSQNQKPKVRFSFNKVSIVVPLYNEEESLIHLVSEIKLAFRDLPLQYEVIFVDDGSTDKSLKIIKDLTRNDQRIKYISFQQNFGKSAALNVGFKAAKGDVIVTMDADLQDDPHEIINLLKKLEEGYDMVSGWKKKRYDPFIKKYTSRLFNFVTATMSGIKIHDFNCGLKAYKKAVVENLNIYGEMHRYIPILAKWKGFTVTELPVKHSPRKFGVTKFGASRFFKGFVDLITVTFITRYIKRPMHLFGFFGALAFFLGFAINGYLSYEWIFDQQPLSNRPLLFLGMLLMIVGVQFFTTGLIGELIVHNFQTDKEYSIKDSNTRG